MACFIDLRFESMTPMIQQLTAVSRSLKTGTCTSQRRTKAPAAPLPPEVAPEEKRPGCAAEKEDFNKTAEM